MSKHQLSAHDDPSASHRSVAAPRTRRSVGVLLTTIGLALFLAGLAFTAGPQVSWRLGQLAADLAQLGLPGGTLAVSGLVLLGLGSLRRAIESQRGQSNPDDSLMLDQIVGELIDLRMFCEQVQSQSGQVAQQIADLGRELETRLAAPAPVDPNAGMPSDALFQLATSLDKLGARLDQRLRVHHETLQGSIDQLDAKVELTARTLEQRWNTVSAVAPAEYPGEAPAAPAQPCCDELATSVPTNSLGVLDTLDDDVRPPLPARTAESDANATARPSNGSWDEQLMVERPDDTQRKLSELHTLLSDERLRAALDGMRKGA